MINWAEKIKELRLKALLTQEELAERLGVALFVNDGNGHCEPTMKAKRELAKLFKNTVLIED